MKIEAKTIYEYEVIVTQKNGREVQMGDVGGIWTAGYTAMRELGKGRSVRIMRRTRTVIVGDFSENVTNEVLSWYRKGGSPASPSRRCTSLRRDGEMTMTADESVRDRVARTLYEIEYGIGGELDDRMRIRYECRADALLAAFPELTLFERLEEWMSADQHRAADIFTVFIGGTRNIRVELEVEDSEGRVTERLAGVGSTVEVALSAALDKAEKKERQR